MAEPNYRRMVAPDGLRRVDVPLGLLKSKLDDGFTIDTVPDHRPALQASLIDRHRGRAAFVFASGPSMAMFPLETILGWVQATGAVVWGTNNVFNVAGGRPIPCDYLMVLDESFWFSREKWIKPYLHDHPDCLPCLGFDIGAGITRYQFVPIAIAATPDTGPEYKPGEYFHGNSSGIAAAQMAMHCGCDPIYLLGHDCTVANGYTHGNGVRSQEELKTGYPQGGGMLAGYDTLARHARERGIGMYNLSPVSAIRSIQFMGEVEMARFITIKRPNKVQVAAPAKAVPAAKPMPAAAKVVARAGAAAPKPAAAPVQHVPVPRVARPAAKIPQPRFVPDNQIPDEDEPDQAMADDEDGDEDGEENVAEGSAFVRMLNADGQVRAVMVGCLLSRMCDGYRFIKGEPAVPRVIGNPEVCDQEGVEGWYPQMRKMAKPNTDQDAMRVWLDAMERDLMVQRYRDKALKLKWGFVATMRNKIMQAAIRGTGAVSVQ